MRPTPFVPKVHCSFNDISQTGSNFLEALFLKVLGVDPQVVSHQLPEFVQAVILIINGHLFLGQVRLKSSFQNISGVVCGSVGISFKPVSRHVTFPTQPQIGHHVQRFPLAMQSASQRPC
jgi:hypothetical protein